MRFIPYFEEALDKDNPETTYEGLTIAFHNVTHIEGVFDVDNQDTHSTHIHIGFCDIPQEPTNLKKYVEKHDFS